MLFRFNQFNILSLLEPNLLNNIVIHYSSLSCWVWHLKLLLLLFSDCIVKLKRFFLIQIKQNFIKVINRHKNFINVVNLKNNHEIFAAVLILLQNKCFPPTLTFFIIKRKINNFLEKCIISFIGKKVSLWKNFLLLDFCSIFTFWYVLKTILLFFWIDVSLHVS